MATRAAICIGVDQAVGMRPLTAAARGAAEFACWAESQGCDVHLLTDQPGQPVLLHHVFEAVRQVVEAATYAQLYLYFSGHGILIAPGAEYWLLSGAPRNPNEAVNLFRSIEDARQAGIPHVIFVSDACRSAATSAPLNGVLGGVIFPYQRAPATSAEVDVFYATQPGNPAYEVPEAEATQQYQGLFTTCLLTAVTTPDSSLVEQLPASIPPLPIITSRSLKPHLIAQVRQAAATVSLTLNQRPEVRVETASPKYFAVAGVSPRPGEPPVPPAEAAPLAGQLPVLPARPPLLPLPGPRTSRALGIPAWLGPVAGADAGTVPRVREAGIGPEVDQLRRYARRRPANTTTGFTIAGAAVVAATTSPAWTVKTLPPPAAGDVHYLRLEPALAPDAAARVSDFAAHTILLEFAGGIGTLLAILPGFIGIVVVEQGRVSSVNYQLAPVAPLVLPTRGATGASWEELKAVAAVTARQGGVTLLDRQEDLLAIERYPYPDPTMALYLAYGYAQRGQLDQVVSTRQRLAGEQALPTLFDLALLTARTRAASAPVALTRLAPPAPLLAQGWALLTPDSPLYQPWHRQLRPHLVPSLWSTYTRAGLELAHTYLFPSL